MRASLLLSAMVIATAINAAWQNITVFSWIVYIALGFFLAIDLKDHYSKK